MNEGATHMAVGEQDGRVVLSFPKDIKFAALDPSNAVHIAKAMIDAAVRCGADVQIQVQKYQLSENKRMALYTRAGHIIRSLQDKPHAYVGVQVVDEVLKEVL